jgi:hypothetical protein
MAIKEPYKPVTDPQERLIQIRGVKKNHNISLLSNEQVEMRVPYTIQEFFAKLLNHIGHRSDWFATCITCANWRDWQQDGGRRYECGKFGCTPPPEVIADGCEYYEDNDQIPF